MLQDCLLGDRRDLVDQVLDKWSLSILAALGNGPRRFSELRRAIPEITQKSLTQALRRLERNGLIDRNVVTTRPVAVQYGVTPLGASLEEPLEFLVRWAARHIDAVSEARARYDAMDVMEFAAPASGA